jgi:hypothetical protein
MHKFDIKLNIYLALINKTLKIVDASNKNFLNKAIYK